MENELVPSAYGLEESQAKEITIGLSTIKKERDALIESFENVIQEEISEENIPMFKTLRLQIRDNRTKGIEPWHKSNKAYFLAGGRFVDAIKNREVQVNTRMEDALMSCEKHYEIQEAKKLQELQTEREALISEFLFEGEEHREYAKMDDELWRAIFDSKKKTHSDWIKAEKKAEENRVAKEKADEAARIAMIAENEKLKKQAEAKAKTDKLEADKRAKAEAKVKAVADAKLKKEQDAKQALLDKLKANQEAEAKRLAKEAELLKAKADAEQAELSKGDADKVKDLINDLEALKTKYSFKSAKYKKTYSDTGLLIDKIVNYIK